MKQGIQRFTYGCGLVIAGLAIPGSSIAALAQLYITEVMANPSAVSDSSGEWFERYNPLAVAWIWTAWRSATTTQTAKASTAAAAC